MKKGSVPPRRLYDMASERSSTILSNTTKLESGKSTNDSKTYSNRPRVSFEENKAITTREESENELSEKITAKLSENSSAGKSLEKTIQSGRLSSVLEDSKKSPNKLEATNWTPQRADGSRSEHQRRFERLKMLHRENPILNLLECINAGNLYTICHTHPEFRPLITSMFRAHVSSDWNRHEQDLLIKIFVKIESVINELVSMKTKLEPSDNLEDAFDRLMWYISEFISILRVHMNDLGAKKLEYASYIATPEGRDWLIKHEKSIVGDENLHELIKPKTYLSTVIETEFLIRIAHENPELKPSVNCVLSVNSAMTFLEYGPQIKVYRILKRIEEHLKQLVRQKNNPELQTDEEIEQTIESILSSVNESFSEIMTSLMDQCKKPKAVGKCLRCPPVAKFVKDASVKPQDITIKIKENPHRNLKGVVAYANHGISQSSLKNLESLIHHLAARRKAFRHVWLYQTCVKWHEIAFQFEEYKSKAAQNRSKMDTLRRHVMKRLDEYEEVMSGAREFVDRVRGISFSYAENLSDEFALSGEMEHLSSEAEDYLTTLDRLIGHFLDDWRRFAKLNSSIRKNRASMLVKKQFLAFEFPLC